MFLDFSIVPMAALIILLVLGLLVLLYYTLVKRFQEAEAERLKPKVAEKSAQWKASFKAQEHDPFKVKIDGKHERVTVNGELAVYHPLGQIDNPVVAQLKDKLILTYTLGDRALYCSIRDSESSKWSLPTCVTVSPQIKTASAYPLVYRVGSGRLFTTYSQDPIATFEPSPYDSSDPTTLVIDKLQGVVLLVYAAKDKGLYRIRSVDGGKTWSASHLIVADAAACRPKLFETKAGIQLVYLSYADASESKAELYLTQSTDNGITFSPVAQKIGPEYVEIGPKKEPPTIYINPIASELSILNHRVSL